MAKNEIKVRYPIVLNNETGKPISIRDVKSGSKLDLVCFNCKNSMIAVNREENKVRPHFKHKNPDCNVAFESYIHWLSKEVFRYLRKVKVPEITFSFMYNYYWGNDLLFSKKINDLFDEYNLPIKIRENSLLNFDMILEKSYDLVYNEFEIESSSNTSIGRIRPDITVHSSSQKYFFEPYYTNPVSDLTFNKIIELDISTIAINLNDFLLDRKLHYSMSELSGFIETDIHSKYWVYINEEKRNKLMLVLLKELKNILVINSNKIKEYNKVLKNIEDVPINKRPFFDKKKILRNSRFKILDEINILDGKVSSLSKKIDEVDKELDSIDENLKQEENKLKIMENTFFFNSN